MEDRVLCDSCGYDLRGHMGRRVRCPECGALVTPDREWAEHRRKLRRLHAADWFLTVCVLAIAILLTIAVVLVVGW